MTNTEKQNLVYKLLEDLAEVNLNHTTKIVLNTIFIDYLKLNNKATPKKVVKGGGWNCPNCNMKLLSGHDLAKENINFCFECGQAILWK